MTVSINHAKTAVMVPGGLSMVTNSTETWGVVTYSCMIVVSTNEPWHDVSNNVVCATSKASDQPAHTRSLIRAFACRLNIL